MQNHKDATNNHKKNDCKPSNKKRMTCFFWHSIRFRACLFVVTLVLISTVPLTYHHLNKSFVLQLKETKDKVLLIANNIARQSNYGVLIENNDLLRGVVEQYKNNQDIKSIHITNSDGLLLFSKGYDGEFIDCNVVISEGLSKINESTLFDGHKGYIACVPINYSQFVLPGSDFSDASDVFLENSNIDDGAILGTIQIGYSLERVHNAMDRSRRDTLWYLLYTVLLTTALAWHALLRAIKPIIEMSSMSKIILANGINNLDRNFIKSKGLYNNKNKNKNEIGSLYSISRKMIAAIIEYRETVDKHNIELTKAKDCAESASESKSIFFSTISHELRTPMNGVIGMAGILQTTEMTKEQREYVETIMSSGQMMVAIINDILDFSKLSNGGIELELMSFKMEDIIQVVYNIVDSDLRKKNLDIVLDINPRINKTYIGDNLRIQQVILNLVNNAVKFTSKGSIDVSVSPLDNDNILFKVTDTGIGIPELYLPSIFDHFTQVDASIARRYGGSGLGLAICKKLISSMGGEIGVTSKIDQGSTFWFSIPLQVDIDNSSIMLPPPTNKVIDSYPTTNNVSSSKQIDRPLRILVAEDNPVNQMVAKTILKKMGHQVVLASNGIEAIKKIELQYFDVVFMDVQMPELDGISATKKIRELPLDCSKIPIIAMTANVSEQDRNNCINAGMCGFVKKPVYQSVIERALLDVILD